MVQKKKYLDSIHQKRMFRKTVDNLRQGCSNFFKLRKPRVFYNQFSENPQNLQKTHPPPNKINYICVFFLPCSFTLCRWICTLLLSLPYVCLDSYNNTELDTLNELGHFNWREDDKINTTFCFRFIETHGFAAF